MKRHKLKNIEDFSSKNLLNCFKGDDIILVQLGTPEGFTFLNCFYLDKNDVLNIETIIKNTNNVVISIPHCKCFKVFRINNMSHFLTPKSTMWFILGADFDIKWFVYENETDFITDNFDILLKANQLNIKYFN